MIEQNAEGVVGCILLNPITGRRWFRVYSDQLDSDGRKEHVDYELKIEELKVVIVGSRASLCTDGDRAWVGWSSKILDRARKPPEELKT